VIACNIRIFRDLKHVVFYEHLQAVLWSYYGPYSSTEKNVKYEDITLTLDACSI
jgi:hypothetical protein